MTSETGQPNGLIDTVPGVARDPATTEATPVAGDRIPVDASTVSDPSRVIGHPDNPFTDMGAALVKHLEAGTDGREEPTHADMGPNADIELPQVPADQAVPKEKRWTPPSN